MVGPQFTVMTADAAMPSPLPSVPGADWTLKLPAAVELSAGVNFSPALPSSKVMKSPSLI
jgi:hypothetical protein